jgi:hypothetical protein
MIHIIDKKFLEMLVMLVHQQNVQLANIIADEEGKLILHRIPSTYKIKQLLSYN